MSDKILKLNQAQTLYNDLRERIEALPTDNDIPTKISDLTDDSGHYTKPATGIPASDLSEEIVSTIDGKAPAIYCEKSGAIVSFDDGAGNMPLKECVVNIEPVQDLHGYDNPWPAGGGKNLLNTVGLAAGTPSSITATTATPRTFTVGTYVTKLSQNNYYNNPVTLQCSVSDNAISVTSSAVAYGVSIPVIGLEIGETYVLSAQKTNGNLYVSFYQQDGTFISNTNKNPENFTIPADTYYTLLHFQTATNDEEGSFTNIQLEKSSTATPYAPYSNVCPITGWTGAKVTRTGKNLFNKEKLIHGQIALTLRYGAYGQDEYNSNTPNRDCFLSAGDYTFSLSGANSTAAETLAVYDETGTRLKLVYNNKIISFTVPVDGYVRITFVIGTQNFVSWDNYDIQLERGSTATTYEPYQGSTYDITFPAEAGTVYGGTLDVITGVLTVDKAIIDLGTLTYVYRDNLGGGAFSATISTPTSPNFPKVKWAGICSKYKYEGTYSNLNNLNRGIGYVFNIDVMVKDTAVTVDDASVMKASLDGVMLCYEIATPITYTLTPQEIRTLLGTNNIWADTGDTAVTYPADTKTFIEQNTPESPVQDVQVNGTSILSNSVANVPVATPGILGVVKPTVTYGVNVLSGGALGLVQPTDAQVKSGIGYVALFPSHQHKATFYGLAKAAGADMKDIANATVGTYPDAQKEAIQSMLGITQMLAPENPNLVASQAYSIGDVFAANGHLYKATAAIAQDGTIIPDTNCVETTMAEAGGKIKDVQVAGNSIVGNDGVANMPKASTTVFGAASILSNGGIILNSEGRLFISSPSETQIRTGTGTYLPLVAPKQHLSVFYGLAKAAGDTTQSQSSNAVGAYTDEAKTAIKAMLGVQDGLKVVRLI